MLDKLNNYKFKLIYKKIIWDKWVHIEYHVV